MSITINHTSVGTIRRTVAGLRHFVRRTADDLHRGWVARRTTAALFALDDATLKDIGVERSGIRRLAADLACGIDSRQPLA